MIEKIKEIVPIEVSSGAIYIGKRCAEGYKLIVVRDV